MLHISTVSSALILVFCVYVTHAQLNCAQYLIPADSMFNHPKIMPELFRDTVITNLTLIHRESYYTCTDEKYGIHNDRKSWWLFKGCGGLFEIHECVTDPTKPMEMRTGLDLTPEQLEIAQKSYQEFGKLKEVMDNSRNDKPGKP